MGKSIVSKLVKHRLKDIETLLSQNFTGYLIHSPCWIGSFSFQRTVIAPNGKLGRVQSCRLDYELRLVHPETPPAVCHEGLIFVRAITFVLQV
jgi:hypothetical protein